MNDLLLTFYGDDFTGSTDAMEALVLGGVPCVLFLEPPTPDLIAERFPHIRALGVAGVSRSMTPEAMDAELPPNFAALKALGTPVLHYKICSTFDSSPTIGSIGHAAEIGRHVVGVAVVPMLVGAPVLKRYMAFGNLFATFGDTTYRLDRHPTMRRHPVTPMDEGDLRLHLARQTTRHIALIDLLALAQPPDTLRARFDALVADGAEIILFDTLDDAHLLAIGRLLWGLPRPVFSVASSGLEYALTAYWRATGITAPPPPLTNPGPVEKLFVVSGSAAPQTAAQITWALNEGGFHGIRLDAPALVDTACADAAREAAIHEALAALSAGQSVVLYSAHGPDDPAIAATTARMQALGLDPREVGALLGAQQGRIARVLLEATGLRRAVVAGGDTCGHAARQLGIYALEIAIPVAPGSPLCRARSHDPRFDGLEISLKAGQVGRPDYFASILRGERPT